MGAGSDWRALFENWPSDLPRQATLTTATQDSIAFIEFRIAGNILLLQRERPDSVGARKVMLAFDAISSLRLSDSGDLSKYRSMGFEAPG